MKKQYSIILSTLLLISIAINIISLLLKNSNGNISRSIDDRIYNSLHTNGSMNVVFTVIAVILLGLFITLFRIDRKVSRLEEEMKGPKS
ncbi:MAG TPA: hypothetical protein VFJ43_01085 [Bacteroidia bacterium]|nr:hypothetical protein [Bacteroidia bacterium]